MTLADVVAEDHKNRKVVAGEHKIRKVFTREHLSAALKSALLARRVQWAASGLDLDEFA